MKRLFIATLITIAVFGQNVSAQFGAQSTIITMYDDNVNNNALQQKSAITTMNINSEYFWDNERSSTKLFYDGNFSYYESLLERTNHFHSLNAEFIHLYGDDDQNILNIGGLLGTSINRDSYSIFDHSLVSSAINYKFFVNDWMINKYGYNLRLMKFSSLDDFSYTEHSLFAHAAFSVTPTTTVILQTDIGTKFYSTSSMGSSSSMRKGIMSTLMPSVTQLTGMIKIGQGITEQIGLSSTTRYQWNLQKQTRYLSSDYGFISDDELFDDHYGYEGLQSSLTFTQLLSESMTWKMTYGIQNKLYSSLAAYDLGGNIMANQRKDLRSYFNILLQKNFEDAGFSLKGAVDIIENSSNDPFYSYKNNAFTLEIGIPFSN